MQFRFLAGALALAPVLVAQTDPAMQTRPQMVWQGDVDTTAFLYIQAKRLQVENKEGAPVANQRYRFNDRLPPSRQDVRLRVIEGRGYVRIVEQPRADNDYTLAIAIEDRQPGGSFYSLALYWDATSIFDRANEGSRGQLKWSGRVEETVMVTCAVDRCSSEALSGAPVMREHFKFTRPLPTRDVEVKLDNVDGRGEVRIAEQPGERNGYTARIEVRDPQAGVGEYAFTLSWRTPVRTDAGVAAARGLLWTGRVEGTVRVTIHGSGAISEVVKGQPVVAERAIFDRPLPARSDVMPSIQKRQGRGSVEIVEYPTNRNGYQLVFEVRDSAGGSDLYEVEVSW